MALASAVLKAFPEGTFGAALPPSALAAAEAALGHPLPAPVKELYLQFDGFLGPTNAQFFLSLLEPPGPMKESLVGFTLFLREEDYCPPWLQSAVAIGNNGTGAGWYVLLDDPSRVVRWSASWGDEYEPLDGSILEVWLREKDLYESIDPAA